MWRYRILSRILGQPNVEFCWYRFNGQEVQMSRLRSLDLLKRILLQCWSGGLGKRLMRSARTKESRCQLQFEIDELRDGDIGFEPVKELESAVTKGLIAKNHWSRWGKAVGYLAGRHRVSVPGLSKLTDVVPLAGCHQSGNKRRWCAAVTGVGPFCKLYVQ